MITWRCLRGSVYFRSIFAAVYQSVFGQDAYPSVEEKAANLLYFMIKNHPYADGCKRIAASLFLEFLDKNNALFLDGEKRLSDGTLVAITLMIAESKPEEKDVMVKLVMNLLKLSSDCRQTWCWALCPAPFLRIAIVL